MCNEREPVRVAAPWLIKGLVTVLNLHPLLAELAEEVRQEFKLDLITSAYRPGNEGVHGQQPVRGLDLRCFDPDKGRAVAEWVNERWCYDQDRPWMNCALYHDAGSGVHLHLQVHPATVRREA